MEKEVIDLIEKYLRNKISATEKEKLIQWCHDVRNRTLSQILYPDEQLVFNPAQNTFRKAYIENKDEAIFWMTNQFVFEEESLESIAKILERMYNVKFKFTSPEIKHIKYSGKIKNNSMENVLNLITTVSPLTFSMTDSCITFRKK